MKLLSTDVPIIVIYWEKFNVQWSSKPYFHLGDTRVSELQYKTFMSTGFLKNILGFIFLRFSLLLLIYYIFEFVFKTMLLIK